MNAIDTKLELRAAEGRPIRVGVIGAGQMGQEIVAQVGQMVGMEIVAVSDITSDRAAAAYGFSVQTRDVVETEDVEEAIKASKAGHCIATSNSAAITEHPMIDAVVDATGIPEVGAATTLSAVNHKKHVVMMNVECDVTVGPILRQFADNAGVTYSLASGDEPAACIELYRFARAIGHTVVAVGKGKNNPLDIYATPDDWREKARERNIMNPRLMVEFVDGSKTMVEMAAVANATGLPPDVPGMHGPKALVKELTRVFSLKSEGGILEKSGVVDYAIGDIHPGVFLVFTTENKRIKEGPCLKALGDGPNYLLYRPYHLCSGEVPLTIARAVFYGESSGHPRDKLTAEVATVAKKNLRRGEQLDMIGEYCYRGSIQLADTARAEHYLPLGLARGCVMKQDVPKDTILTYDMVEMDDNSLLLQLRRIQDRTM